jgi:predicted porin
MNLAFRASLTAAIVTCLPALASAQSSVQVNGQVRLTANHISVDGGNSFNELRDNASRLGFRGTEDLGGGLRAAFGLEFGYSADTGEMGAPAFRHSYVGLVGGFGAVTLGRLDSGTPSGSPLYSQVTAITSFAPNDAGATAIGTSMLNSRNRVSNAIGYATPNLGGFVGRARYYLRGTGAGTEAEDDARSLDLGVNYENGPIRAAIGYGKDQRSGGLKAAEFDHKWQAGMRYDFGMFEPYALVGVDRFAAKTGNRRNVRYWIAGVKAGSDAHSVVFNLLGRQVLSNPKGERRRGQLAYMYKLSKRTELQAFVDVDDADSSKSKDRTRAIGAGIRHDF